MNTHIDAARTLCDDDLLARVRALAAQERGVEAELIAHLAEVQRRKLHLEAGYSSLFLYCRGVLHLSEHAAYHRIVAARAARRFPVIIDRLAEGALNITTVKLLAPHLTDDNHVEVLESARGRSRRHVEKIVARLAPLPDVPTRVQKLPAPPAAPPTVVPSPAVLTMAAHSLGEVAPPPLAMASVPPAPAPAVVSALSPDRYKLQLTIDGDTLEKLELAKDMLRHAIPSGNDAQILGRALTLLLVDLAQKKFAATDRPRAALEVAADSRWIPAPVKRAVWVRDLGRCAFVGRDGHRCNARDFVEFHHVHPYVEGGLPTVDNLELRCRAHNLYEWEQRSTEVRKLEYEWQYRLTDEKVAVSTRPGPSRLPNVRTQEYEWHRGQAAAGGA